MLLECGHICMSAVWECNAHVKNVGLPVSLLFWKVMLLECDLTCISAVLGMQCSF